MSTRILSASLIALALTVAARAGLAPSAAATRPLAVGSPVPAVTVLTMDKRVLDLADAIAGKPALVVFYRGSWCPYCNRHLAALQEIEPKLLKMGFRIFALSPDGGDGLRAMQGKNHLNYQLLSDSAMLASGAFGVAFRVDPETVEKYREWKIELKPVPGEPDARWLPVPAAFIIGRDGIVRFVHADPDYKVRISTAALLAAARQAAE